MNSKLNEDPGTCPACNKSLHNRKCNAVGCYLGTDDTMHSAGQMRLMLSWDAAIKDIGFRELGGSQW